MTTLDELTARQARRRRRRRRRVVLVALPLLVVLGAVGWFLLQAYPLSGPGHDAVFYVRDGEPFSQIADELAANGVIGSALAFRLDAMVTGTPDATPGWYAMPTSSSFSAVRAALGAGPNATAVEVTGGESTLEIRGTLADVEGPRFATAFYTLARDGAVPSAFQPVPGTSLEGLVAPGTYVLVPHETPRVLLRQMVRRFVHEAAALGLTPRTVIHHLSAYDLVTVASIVEKEGYLAPNMPKTATVVFNRLAQGMPLQMDSTVEYAIGQDGGQVTRRTEEIRSPYNTYLHPGLTPTPICTPSTSAIRATLHAPHGPWLFFVVVNQNGTMAFSTTFAQQLANERLAASRGL